MNAVCEFLDKNDISYLSCEHPAVFTVEQAQQFVPPLPGAATKNLFLRDKKGKRHLLVTVPEEKPVNLKTLGKDLGLGHLSFASSDRLKKYLDIEPGSVSLLAIMNDRNNEVELLIDEDLWSKDALLCHPLVNTSTLSIPRDGIEKFLTLLKRDFRLVAIP